MLKRKSHILSLLVQFLLGAIGVVIFCHLFLNLTTCFIAYLDEGDNLLFMQQVPYGETISMPDAPAREGYTFVGWDTEATQARSSMKIHAQYRINRYSVRFLDMDGTLLATRTCPYGTDAKAPTAPDHEGYVFTGWDKNYVDIHEDMDVTAQYEKLETEEPPEEAPVEITEEASVVEDVSTETQADKSSATTKPETKSKTVETSSASASRADSAVKAEAKASTTAATKTKTKAETCSYCGSTEHAKAYCAKRSVANGAIGRWVIPDVGVNVACYDSNEQSVCDRKDSAASWQNGAGLQRFIADHWNQGFDAIKKCVVGTKAYMDNGETKTWYVCTSVEDGHNTGLGLVDNNYQAFEDRNQGGMTCYTCNGNWKNIKIVFFAPA